jgi:ribonuclease P protein component
MWRSMDTAGFRVALQAPVVARSAHFAVHHVTGPVLGLGSQDTEAVIQDLSTENGPSRAQTVDKLPASVDASTHVLGVMVPKRHAKRAVTRNLVKRLVRETVLAASRQFQGGARPGTWLVRLRQPLNRRAFPSAKSDALRLALRAELHQLMQQAMPPLAAGSAA